MRTLERNTYLCREQKTYSRKMRRPVRVVVVNDLYDAIGIIVFCLLIGVACGVAYIFHKYPIIATIVETIIYIVYIGAVLLFVYKVVELIVKGVRKHRRKKRATPPPIPRHLQEINKE